MATDTPLPRPLRATLRRLATIAVALLVVLGPTVHAHAAPTPAEIEKQIDAAWNELEPLIEEYNKVRGLLQENRTKSKALQKKLEPLQAQVDQALAEVGAIASHLYRSGPASTLTSIINTGSPTTLADQLTTLDLLARARQQQIKDVVVLRDRYAADKKTLDDLITEQTHQDADLAAKTKDIEARIAELQKLRREAYKDGGGTGALRPVACPVDYLGGPGGTAAKAACSYIGAPYVWASSNPSVGLDCSGLTKAAWSKSGINLRHYTNWQWSDTTPVSRANLRIGDLVFFYSDLHHVGLYVGDGWMVHAPTFGDQVRMAKIDGFPIAGYRRPGG